MPEITLILGGARSGKSARALALAEPPRALIATAEPGDAEMAARIARHKAERGPDWALIEAPLGLPERALLARVRARPPPLRHGDPPRPSLRSRAPPSA